MCIHVSSVADAEAFCTEIKNWLQIHFRVYKICPVVDILNKENIKALSLLD